MGAYIYAYICHILQGKCVKILEGKCAKGKQTTTVYHGWVWSWAGRGVGEHAGALLLFLPESFTVTSPPPSPTTHWSCWSSSSTTTTFNHTELPLILLGFCSAASPPKMGLGLIMLPLFCGGVAVSLYQLFDKSGIWLVFIELSCKSKKVFVQRAVLTFKAWKSVHALSCPPYSLLWPHMVVRIQAPA